MGVVDVVVVLEVPLHGDDAGVAQLSDLVGLRVPAGDVLVGAHAQRAAGDDEGALRVGEAAGDDAALLGLGAAGLLGRHEARADPGARGALHQARRQRPPAADPARGHHERRRPAQHRRRVPPRHVHDGRDQHRVGDLARVPAALAALRADHVDAEVEGLDGAVCLNSLELVMMSNLGENYFSEKMLVKAIDGSQTLPKDNDTKK